jgi:hypothetical protein
MRKSLSIMSGGTENVSPNSGVSIPGELPRRLMTAFEVARLCRMPRRKRSSCVLVRAAQTPAIRRPKLPLRSR